MLQNSKNQRKHGYNVMSIVHILVLIYNPSVDSQTLYSSRDYLVPIVTK